MQLVFADEFGDFSSSLNINDGSKRPICGYAGLVIPSENYKGFAENFYRLRIVADRNILFSKIPNSSYLEEMYRTDGLAAAMRYELKGRDVFSTSYVNRRTVSGTWKKANVFQYARWFLRMLGNHGGEIIYAGIEKQAYFERRARKGRTLRRPLHVELVRDILETAHKIARQKKRHIKLIFDHHPKDDETNARTAARNQRKHVNAEPELQTRQEYCREIMLEKGYYDYVKEPFFHVPSEWSAGVQAADWVCTLLTKAKSYEINRVEYARYQLFHEKLGGCIEDLSSSESTIRYFAGAPKRQLPLPF